MRKNLRKNVLADTVVPEIFKYFLPNALIMRALPFIMRKNAMNVMRAVEKHPGAVKSKIFREIPSANSVYERVKEGEELGFLYVLRGEKRTDTHIWLTETGQQLLRMMKNSHTEGTDDKKVYTKCEFCGRTSPISESRIYSLKKCDSITGPNDPADKFSIICRKCTEKLQKATEELIEEGLDDS